MDQISMFDLKPKKFQMPMWPEYDECYKTCKHFLPLDTYVCSRKKRCSYPLTQEGTSGGWSIQVVQNNEVHFWCKYYEEEL